MDELEINTLHRFVKHSPGLMLEQHSSCEVPAGCAGVVIRWLNPTQEAYLHFTFYAPGESQLYLDGQPIRSSLFSVPVGPHVLALHLQDSASFLLAVQRHPEPHQQLLLNSQGDGSWWATREEPSADWNQLDFDAGNWRALKEYGLPLYAQNNWQRQSAAKLGARPIGRAGAGPLWVRKAFELTP